MASNQETVEFLVGEMLTIYGAKFTDAGSRQHAIDTWARQFRSALSEKTETDEEFARQVEEFENFGKVPSAERWMWWEGSGGYLVGTAGKSVAWVENSAEAMAICNAVNGSVSSATAPLKPWPEMVSAAKDAARYRWLRQNADEVFAAEAVEWQVKYGNLPAQLDDAIDAAMNATDSGSADG